MDDLTPTQVARIRRRQAHMAAKQISQTRLRNPVMDKIRAMASKEARKANVTFAMLKGIPLHVIETPPKSNSRRITYDRTLNKLLRGLGFRETIV